jgi:hypothetical protein
MERKEFLKCSCGIGIASCLGLGFLTSGNLFASTEPDGKTDKKTPVVPVEPRQLQNVLSYIENNTDESTKKNIFDKLGYEHTTSEGFIKWIEGYKNNLKGFFDHINSNKDTYWEKMEYNPDNSTIKITGKVVDRCACPYAQNDNPPKCLCKYCCISFQKSMFEMLLNKSVRVETDEAFLLGGKRCSSTIFINGKLPIEKI